jgi:beta-alanine--pyruvate transaminase
MAPHWQEAMHALRGPPNVIDIRTIGLMAGIELSSRPDARCFSRGLAVRITGDTLGLSPPLIVKSEQIDEMAAILASAIKRVA